MITLPNLLSLVRIPAAFLFLQDQLWLRFAGLLIAMVSDCLDGFLARRFRMSSRVGLFLDPIADKFFVYFVLWIFISEGQIAPWQALALISRDFTVTLFTFYVFVTKTSFYYDKHPFWCGKISTSLQFFFLLMLTFYVPIPVYGYGLFIAIGIAALGELYSKRETDKGKDPSTLKI